MHSNSFYALPLDGKNKTKSKKVASLAPVGRWDAGGLLKVQEARAEYYKQQKESQELLTLTKGLEQVNLTTVNLRMFPH